MANVEYGLQMYCLRDITGTDLKDAVAKAYAGCEPISWTDMHKRTDIGKVWVD